MLTFPYKYHMMILCPNLWEVEPVRRTAGYQTKQRGAILAYIFSLEGAHVTAAQIIAHFEAAGASIGRATVYRHLAALADAGTLRRFVNGSGGACYQYAGAADIAGCGEHLHLKCESCGVLRLLECDALADMRLHLSERHAFAVNPLKTVLYGLCDDCSRLATGNRLPGNRNSP